MNKKLLLAFLPVLLLTLLAPLAFTACCAHEFTTETVAPTCDAEGYTLHTCTLCGVTQTTDPVSALGHTYGATEFACSTRVCTVCEHREPSETAHVHTSETFAPTCTEGGYTSHTCSVCGEISYTDELPALGHSVYQAVVPPSCTKDGFTVEICTACGATERTEPTTALGHSYEDTVVAPTCKAVGYTKHVCAACGDSYRDAETETVDHEYDSDNPCQLRNCLNCDAFLMPAHDDVLIKTVAAPTLAADGRGLFRCNNCKREYNAAIPAVKPQDLGVPVIYLTGSMSGMSKENDKVLSVVYESTDLNFSCVAEMHWQGASSAGYAKKNYTIKFYHDNTLQKKYKFDPFGWGAESKYCLKANWVDISQARNVVGGRLWGDVCFSRKNLDPNLALAPNYGAIDGYPVVVYHEGQFLGLYTMNIPKDNWMFGIEKDDTVKQAILFTHDWGAGPSMQEPIARGFSNGWGVEYCSTTDTEWARTSMNNLINFINSNDGYQFRRGIGKYLDVEAAIDVMLYTYVIAAFDNSAKNILYVTYDGVKWIPSMYDMDGTFGMYWNGTFISSIQDMTPGFRSDGSVTDNVSNNLWQKLFDNYKAEIKARYFELREGALSMTNIEKRFDEFFASVPQILYDAEQQRWPNAPGRGKNNRNQIITFTRDRLNYLDSVFNQM